jgi:hypothetical protein
MPDEAIDNEGNSTDSEVNIDSEPLNDTREEEEINRASRVATHNFDDATRNQVNTDRELLGRTSYSADNRSADDYRMQENIFTPPSGNLPSDQETVEGGGIQGRLSRLTNEAIGAHESLQRVKPPKKLFYKRFKFWAVVVATANFFVMSSRFILDVIQIAAALRGTGRGSGVDDLTDEQKAILTRAVKRWQRQDPEKVWNCFIEYCDRYNPSLQEQLLMTDTIKQLAPLVSPPWVWSSSDDKADAVWACSNAFADAKPSKGESRSRYLYIAVRDYKYNGQGKGPQKLPLAIAAEIAWIAVGHLYCTWHPKKEIS